MYKLVRLLIDSASEQAASAKETRIPLAPKWTRLLIILGALLDVASALFPWGLTHHLEYSFLPWSPVWGEESYALPPEAPYTTVSILIRAAAVIGWSGVILYHHFERQAGLHVAVLVSGVLPLAAFVLFAQASVYLSLGAYLALLSGVLMVSSVLLQKLEVEVIVLHEQEP